MSRNPTYIKLIQTNRWRELRLTKLMNNPLCEVCEREGRSSLASEVHHIKPVESVYAQQAMEHLMYSYDNLMSVCHQCHVSIHIDMKSHSKDNIKKSNKKAVKAFSDKYL